MLPLFLASFAGFPDEAPPRPDAAGPAPLECPMPLVDVASLECPAVLSAHEEEAFLALLGLSVGQVRWSEQDIVLGYLRGTPWSAFRSGDTIRRINGIDVSDQHALTRLRLAPGMSVVVEVSGPRRASTVTFGVESCAQAPLPRRGCLRQSRIRER